MIMKPKKIKVWLARDDNQAKETYLWTKKPKFYAISKEFNITPIRERWGKYAKMPRHYGLKPGECMPATLVIGEENENMGEKEI